MPSKNERIAAIALGSNLGDSLTILEGAIAQIQDRLRIPSLQRSSWYRTKPIGPPQPDYLNGCVAFPYQGTAEDLMRLLLDIELEFGRERLVHWGARTLDLDLLLLGQEIYETEFLALPHPRMAERAFVLLPLQEVYPTWIHPRLNQIVSEMLQLVSMDDIEKL